MKTKGHILLIYLLLSGFHPIIGQENKTCYVTKQLNGKEYSIGYNSKYQTITVCDKAIVEKKSTSYINSEYFGSARFERDFRPELKQTLMTQEQRNFFTKERKGLFIKILVDTRNENIGTYITVQESFFDVDGKDKRKLSLADIIRMIEFVEKEKTRIWLDPRAGDYGYISLLFSIFFHR